MAGSVGEQKLAVFFENYIKSESIFASKKVLQTSFIPEVINHREEQIRQIAQVLAPLLRNEKPSNLFIYGKSGTGKTLSIKHITSEVNKAAAKNNIPLTILYVNCKLKKTADTEYRLVAQLSRELGKIIPATGLPTEEVYKIFFEAIDSISTNIVLVLDEIDQLVKKAGDEALYNLTRINEELKNSQISIVGISNDLIFVEGLDPRVKSSLSEEEVFFPPYNAVQLQEILMQRAKQAFMGNAVEEGVIEKCAAYAAREHGDARRALELLRVAGEVADRNNSEKLAVKHIDEAEDKIEKDRILDMIITQPKQFQLTLYSLLSVNPKGAVFTGEIYEVYKKLCEKTGTRPLTQRRISDIIGEMDMIGIINAKVISKGRYGRTREISLSTSSSINPQLKKILEAALAI